MERGHDGVGAQIAATGRASLDSGGVGGVDHVDGFGRIGDAQRYAQAGVRANLGRQGAARSLRREDEVHTEGAATLGHAHQAAQETGQLLRQRGELVDEDDEPGEVRARPGLPVRVEVGDAGFGEQPLPAAQFGVE